jgi:hypothetical protein
MEILIYGFLFICLVALFAFLAGSDIEELMNITDRTEDLPDLDHRDHMETRL